MIFNENEPIKLTINTNKPWMTAEGKIRPDDELREMATNWTASTWEAFLADCKMAEAAEADPENEESVSYASTDERFSTENTLKKFISDLKVESLPSLSKALQDAMSELSDQQQKIVRLFFWEGMNQTQIAVHINTSQQVVSMQLARAVKKLRAEMLDKISVVIAAIAESDPKKSCLNAPEQNPEISRT